MTDTLTLKQVNALEHLHRLVTWDSINSFVACTFVDTDTRLRVLRALEATLRQQCNWAQLEALRAQRCIP